MKPKALLATLLIGTPLVLSLPAALVIAVAEWFPASWFIELQVRWNGGYYYGKLTFLLTWLLLLMAIAVPLELAGGGAAWVRGLFREQPPVPSNLTARVVSTRLLRFVGGAVGTALCVLFLGACAIRPDLFDGLGFLASTLLLISVAGPVVGLLFVFDGACAVEVIEGRVEARQEIPQPRGLSIYKLTLDGQERTVTRQVWVAASQGARVRLVLTGFLGGTLGFEVL